MGDLMDVLTRYAESDNMKDPTSDDEKSGKGKKNGGKGHQPNGNGNNNNNNHKCKNHERSSDFVANTNTGFKNQGPEQKFQETLFWKSPS
jgi:hypothetical protein